MKKAEQSQFWVSLENVQRGWDHEREHSSVSRQEGQINEEHHSWCLENVLIKSWGFNNLTSLYSYKFALAAWIPLKEWKTKLNVP